MSEREAGAKGGAVRCYRGGGPGLGHALSTRREAAMRYAMREGTQAEIAALYGVSRSTLRRWWCEWGEAVGD